MTLIAIAIALVVGFFFGRVTRRARTMLDELRDEHARYSTRKTTPIVAPMVDIRRDPMRSTGTHAPVAH